MGRNRELKYKIDENGCWIITSHMSQRNKPPQIMIDSKLYQPHRYFYEKYIGKIDKGYIVKRICENILCCNPYHISLEKKQRDIEYKVTENNCWEITSHTAKSDGYTVIYINKKQHFAHRYFYQQRYGKISSDIIIRHKCDNPACVNPDHLEEGTHADNVRDRVERNRSAVGEKNGRAKLTEENVRYIRENSTMTNTELGRMFGVDTKVIREVKQFKKWKHVK